MYDCIKLYNVACSNACRPVVIHAVLMSIIFEHYKQLTKLMEQQKDNDKNRSSVLLICGHRQLDATVIPDNRLQAVRTRLLEEIKATKKRIHPVLHPLFNLTMQNKIDHVNRIRSYG